MSKPIKDILYEYIYCTPFEKKIIEHATFQRLRFIYQNSSAYLTYPSNTLNRFSHSLGVMHLGSLFFITAFKNSTADVQKALIVEYKKEIINVAKCFNTTIEQLIIYADEICKKHKVKQNLFEFPINYESLSSGEAENEMTEKEAVFIVNFICQSLRIACLAHDIGHLPLSHIFEDGLKRLKEINRDDNSVDKLLTSLSTDILDNNQFINSNRNNSVLLLRPETNQLHEYCGAHIIDAIREKEKEKATGAYEEKEVLLFECIISFGLYIFLFTENSNPELLINKYNSVVTILKKIVSSEIDADRLDYTMRDAVSSGMQLGNFDYTRLLSNLYFEISSDTSTSTSTPAYHLLIESHAISSLEQFYNYRFLLYEYVYYHHNVAKYDGIAAEIIGQIFNISMRENNENANEIRKIMLRYKAIDNDSNLFADRTFKIYDDCWLRALLIDILFYLSEKSENQYKNIERLISVFLYREKDYTYSIFKTQVDYESFFDEKILSDITSEFNNRAKGLVDELSIDKKMKLFEENRDFREFWGLHLNSTQKSHISTMKSLINKLHDFNYRENNSNLQLEFINKIKNDLTENSDLSSLNLTLITKSTKPKIFKAKSLKVFVKENNNDELIYIENLSTYLHNLAKYNSEEINLYFGVVSSSAAITDNNKEVITQIFKKNLKEFLIGIAINYTTFIEDCINK